LIYAILRYLKQCWCPISSTYFVFCMLALIIWVGYGGNRCQCKFSGRGIFLVNEWNLVAFWTLVYSYTTVRYCIYAREHGTLKLYKYVQSCVHVYTVILHTMIFEISQNTVEVIQFKCSEPTALPKAPDSVQKAVQLRNHIFYKTKYEATVGRERERERVLLSLLPFPCNVSEASITTPWASGI
jgi:hypothetical protein